MNKIIFIFYLNIKAILSKNYTFTPLLLFHLSFVNVIKNNLGLHRIRFFNNMAYDSNRDKSVQCELK